MDSPAAAPQDWLRFTPASINPHLCLARTWNQGLGGQCPKARRPGSELCGLHSTKWEVHGRVDGPIPELKFREFERHSRNNPKRPEAAAGKASTEKASVGMASAPNATNPKRLEAAADKASAEKASTGKASTRANATNAGATRKRKVPPVLPVAGQRPRTRSQTLRASSNGSRDQARAAAPRLAAAGGKLPTGRAAKPRKAKPSKAVKCTCGKPIHSEKCKLFQPRPSVYGSAPFARARQAHARPTNERAKAESSRASLSSASSVRLTEWAREQVARMAAEVTAQPLELQKAAWKQRLKLFHPDKMEAGQRDGLLTGRIEAEVREVFEELKRRYDRAVDRERKWAELSRRRAAVPRT